MAGAQEGKGFIVTDTVVSLRARLTTLETNFDVLTEKLRKRDFGSGYTLATSLLVSTRHMHK